MTETPLAGKTAIVTGASAGIGRATTHRLARDGANVVLASRTESRLTALADEVESETGTETLVVPTDVTDETAVEALFTATVERFGGFDVLVNNAGIAEGSAIETMTTEQYRAMMDTNVDGMFFTTRAALPHLHESGGTLVFIGSFAGKYPRPFNPVYAATKWWTRGFALSVSGQVGDEVGVAVINPGQVRSEFTVEGTRFDERFEPGDATEPEEVADAVAFAARQSNSEVAELDLHVRDKFTMF
jgi:NADP-dependent 3-hydroxy acid dehydrogenase YdfG